MGKKACFVTSLSGISWSWTDQARNRGSLALGHLRKWWALRKVEKSCGGGCQESVVQRQEGVREMDG